MSCTLIAEPGNPLTLQTVLRNTLDPQRPPINNATVTVRLEDAAGVPVPGETWPVVLPYVSGSDGIYRRGLAVSLPVGWVGDAHFFYDVPGAAGVVERVYSVVVAEKGCGKPAPPSSPASPAYKGKSLIVQLNEAEDALHSLMLGRQARVIVDQNGERVEFTATNRLSLQQYVDSLRRQLGRGDSFGPAGVCI